MRGLETFRQDVRTRIAHRPPGGPDRRPDHPLRHGVEYKPDRRGTPDVPGQWTAEISTSPAGFGESQIAHAAITSVSPQKKNTRLVAIIMAWARSV